ncbi:MAG: SDR family NAD(P)-dependent oxidoreductase [Nitrosomonadales bacterium]|nr:SDR family NAD(P)-dependent oxidoreductase [Nitrosomonadales bacterium]
MSEAVLILGATSAIARATANAFAARGAALYLASRDTEELRRIAADIHLRYGVEVHHGLFDAEATGTHDAFFKSVLAAMPKLSGVVLAFGYLGDQQAARDFKIGARVIASNFTGAASILSHCANYFEPDGQARFPHPNPPPKGEGANETLRDLRVKRRGFIIGISSVAGDRGRQSNYVYGAAKGALSLYLQGLRNRLYASGVRVITVKPGFVDTAMTYGLPGLFLVASPQSVGERIVAALGKSADVVYLPWFWRYIMLIIRHIPEPVFKRLKL